jgi:hypothetical protein
MKNNTHMGDKNILFIEFLNNKQQETNVSERNTYLPTDCCFNELAL